MRFTHFIFAIGLAVLAAQAQAVGSLVDVAVYDRAENRTLPVYFHGGRYYVVGKPGNEYQVTVRNRQSSDIMTVVSVDGVNAVSGETAHWSQTGYVFGAGASYAISGWRKSLQHVARFYFTELENSYAARSGRPENVGVIGVAVFRRRAEPAVGIGGMRERQREIALRKRSGNRRPRRRCRPRRALAPATESASRHRCAIRISNAHRLPPTRSSPFITTAIAICRRRA
jgi:hypothetical protein